MKTIFKVRLINTLLIIIFILVLNPISIKAQRSYDDKFFTGGSLGFQFGSVTLIDVSPILGYRLTEKIDVGVGVTYKYFKSYIIDQYTNTQYNFTSNIYGGSVFGRYHFTDNFFGHVETEYLNYNIDDYSYGFKQNKTIGITSVFIGGGYRQEMGNNSYLTLMVLYNLNETQYSPYTNPIIRIGYTLGF